MRAKRKPLSFDDAVRVGARVPLLFAFLSLAFLALATTSFWPYVDAALRDAPVANAEELSGGHKGPVRVRVDAVVPKTPLTKTNAVIVVSSDQQIVGIAGTKDSFSGNVQSGSAVWGVLRPINVAEKETLRMENSAGGASADAGMPLHVLNTAVPSRAELLGLLGLGTFGALVACFVIIRSIGIVRDPLRSASGRALALFGDAAAVRDAFDAVIADEHPVVGSLHGPKGFIAFRRRSGYLVLPRPDVMWVRQRPGVEPAFFSVMALPVLAFRTLAARSVYLYERSGFRLRVSVSSRYERAAVTRELETLCPHTIFVDDAATKKYWRFHRSHFVEAVDQRRIALEEYLAGTISGTSTARPPTSVGPTLAPVPATPPIDVPATPAAVLATPTLLGQQSL